MMKYIFTLMILSSFIYASEKESFPIITVHSTSEVSALANNIIFTVIIKTKSTNPNKVYSDHKILEKKLLDLFRKFQIPDTNITYSLLNLNSYSTTRRKNGQDEDVYYYTSNQSVTILLKNISSYLDFQLALLENGFHQFRSKFSSSNITGLKELGYKRALNIAEKNASIIVSNMGKKLGKIFEVVAEADEKFNFEKPTIQRYYRDESRSLTNISQNVIVKTKLKVTYCIID